MTRCLLSVGMFFVACGWTQAEGPATEPTGPIRPEAVAPALPPELQAAAPAKQAAAITGRKQLEALLHAPAKLDFSGRKTITVKELLDQLHERQQLSIRFDMQTLSGLFGLSAFHPEQASAYSPPQPAARGYPTHPPASGVCSTIGSPIGACADGLMGSVPLPLPHSTTASGLALPSPHCLSDEGQYFLPGQETKSESKPVAGPVPYAPAACCPQCEMCPGLDCATGPLQKVLSHLECLAMPCETAQPAAAPEPCEPPQLPVAPKVADSPQALFDAMLNLEIDVQTVDLQNVSVGTALRHALDALPSAGEASGLPIALTNAALFDYIVEEDGLLITTRMKALTYKETRVYSTKNLHDITPEQLAAVIQKSVRPWSWRSRIDELGDKLKAGSTQLPPELLGSIVKSGIQLTSAETGIVIGTPESADEKSDAKKGSPAKAGQASDAEQMQMLGNALVNGAVTFAHTTLTALEIMHYADPPTGAIQTLPGKLVITQSQAAHREIADLLKQLSEE